jgi:hypothetical protein
LTSEQVNEWQAYDKLEPIGEQRADYRLAILCSVITNIARAIWGKKGCKMSTIDDFLFRWDREEQVVAEPKKQSVGDMKKILQTIVQLSGKK